MMIDTVMCVSIPGFYLGQKFWEGNMEGKAGLMGHLGGPRRWVQEEITHGKLKHKLIIPFPKGYLSNSSGDP